VFLCYSGWGRRSRQNGPYRRKLYLAGSRITDYISLGVIAKFFPLEKVREALHQTNRASLRERDLARPCGGLLRSSRWRFNMRSSYREVLRCFAGGSAVVIGSVGHGKGRGQNRGSRKPAADWGPNR